MQNQRPTDGVLSFLGSNRSNLEAIKFRDNLRQQRMESELDKRTIQDTDDSLLLRNSDESDSLDELVIKDFTVRVVQSETDAAISSLPITEQAIIESNKLRDSIESIRQRFQVKVARDKFAERGKQNRPVPKTQVVRSSVTPTSDTTKQSSSPSVRTTPVNVNIMDSTNYGNAALAKPLFDYDEPPEELHFTTSDEDFLNEEDMQFDDVFGDDNLAEPATLGKAPQPQLQQNYQTSTPQRQPLKIPKQTEKLLDSDENIEDFESPQFSDESIPSSDDSVQIIPQQGDARLPSGDQSKGKIETNDKSASNRIETETQQDKDIKKIKELLDSGALKLSIANQQFEDGVLDLLLRQSTSLWDPVVGGIPIAYVVPSQNHEKGLLDTSINETHLESPLIKKAAKTLPGYMVSLENEWTTNSEPIDMNNNVVDDEHVLVPGIPKFTYEPLPDDPYRRKVPNIMDSEEESEESDGILADHEMNFDDLTNDTAEPTFNFRGSSFLYDLEMKMKSLRRLKENIDPLAAVSNQSSPLGVFNQNRQQFNALFGIGQNEKLGKKCVTSNDIDSLYNRTPSIDSRIVRNVPNCPYHLGLLQMIYKKIRKFISQPEQPCSSHTQDNLNEMMERFNRIKDGHICARIQICPTGRNVESSHVRNDQATQTTQVCYTKPPVDDPIKVRRSVSFADSLDENESPAKPVSVANARGATSNKGQKNRP